MEVSMFEKFRFGKFGGGIPFYPMRGVCGLVFPAQAQDRLKVGHLPVRGHAKFFVAKEGLDVELLEFINSADGINAVRAGKLDIGAYGTTAPLVHIAPPRGRSADHRRHHKGGCGDRHDGRQRPLLNERSKTTADGDFTGESLAGTRSISVSKLKHALTLQAAAASSDRCLEFYKAE